MTTRADVLRQQAAEFRKLAASSGNAPELRARLEALAEQCERIAAEIERGKKSG
jgi:hypothetical protein